MLSDSMGGRGETARNVGLTMPELTGNPAYLISAYTSLPI
jgi:hypothetical protein